MRMKQIIAKDMKEAMVLARETLGDDAVLLSTQKQPGSKGIVVTFAVEEELFEETFQSPFEQTSNDNFAPEPEPEPAQKPAAPKADAKPAPAKPASSVARSSYPAYDLLLSIMAYHKLPEALFIKLTALLDRIDLPEQLSYETCEQILTQIIGPHVTMKPLNVAEHLNGKALMFVGPYASGKTSLVAKYATQAHMAGLPVMIFSTDTQRMAGLAMLEGLKPLLGIEVMVAETRNQLRNLATEVDDEDGIVGLHGGPIVMRPIAVNYRCASRLIQFLLVPLDAKRPVHNNSLLSPRRQRGSHGSYIRQAGSGIRQQPGVHGH